MGHSLLHKVVKQVKGISLRQTLQALELSIQWNFKRPHQVKRNNPLLN